MPAGRVCRPAARLARPFSFSSANCPAPPCPKPALCWGPVAHTQARHRRIFCGAGRCFPAQKHTKPPWQPFGLPRGLCFACVKKQTCSPLPLRRHRAGAQPGAASAHFLMRGAFGAARRARLQPAARWRRASASCAASWAYSGLSNRLA